jgi:hypothetical protein
MVNGAGLGGYQPAVAFQGGQVNTPFQEPKTGQTQPREAAAADSQRADQKSLASRDEREHKEGREEPQPRRGSVVDISA